MPFTNPIVAGTTLVRPAIASPNYVAGTSGWTVNVDGTAEFNNVTVRGNLQVGSPTGSEITTTFGGIFNQASLNFFTHNVGIPAQTETSSGTIGAQVNGDLPQLVIQSPGTDNGNGFIALQSSSSLNNGLFEVGSTAPIGGSGINMIALFFAGVQTQLVNPNPVTGSCALLIGAAGANPRTFLGPNQIQGTNNSAVADLQLNPVGRGVSCPAMMHLFARDTNTLNTGAVANTFSSPAGTTATVNFTLPPSGVVTVHTKGVINAGIAAGTLWGDVIVKNNTQSTTPYGGSINNGWTAFSTPSVGNSFSSFVTLGNGGQGGFLGNSGDSMTATVAYAPSTAAAWQVKQVQLTVVPSL